jgi:hypothetical protein
VEGWTWVEGTINAPPQAVFEWFADDSDHLPLIVPQVRVVGPVERERLANGGLRMRARLKFLWTTREVVAEDTAYEPYTLLRGLTQAARPWSRAKSGSRRCPEVRTWSGAHAWRSLDSARG